MRIPLLPASAQRKKNGGENPDEIVRGLKALRTAISLILERPDYSVALFERSLRVEPLLAEKLYKLYRDQYNPGLSLPDSVVEDLLAVGTFRLKEKPKTAPSLQAVHELELRGKGETLTRGTVQPDVQGCEGKAENFELGSLNWCQEALMKIIARKQTDFGCRHFRRASFQWLCQGHQLRLAERRGLVEPTLQGRVGKRPVRKRRPEGPDDHVSRHQPDARRSHGR